jgi:MinD-like ATPase involved in chromosome partitioning or flagellar assembly
VGSINLGTPLVQAEPTSKIALEIRRIAEQISMGLAPIDQSKQRRPFWAGLLKKQSAQPNFKLQTSMEKV